MVHNTINIKSIILLRLLPACVVWLVMGLMPMQVIAEDAQQPTTILSQFWQKEFVIFCVNIKGNNLKDNTKISATKLKCLTNFYDSVSGNSYSNAIKNNEFIFLKELSSLEEELNDHPEKTLSFNKEKFIKLPTDDSLKSELIKSELNGDDLAKKVCEIDNFTETLEKSCKDTVKQNILSGDKVLKVNINSTYTLTDKELTLTGSCDNFSKNQSFIIVVKQQQEEQSTTVATSDKISCQTDANTDSGTWSHKFDLSSNSQIDKKNQSTTVQAFKMAENNLEELSDPVKLQMSIAGDYEYKFSYKNAPKDAEINSVEEIFRSKLNEAINSIKNNDGDPIDGMSVTVTKKLNWYQSIGQFFVNIFNWFDKFSFALGVVLLIAFTKLLRYLAKPTDAKSGEWAKKILNLLGLSESDNERKKHNMGNYHQLVQDLEVSPKVIDNINKSVKENSSYISDKPDIINILLQQIIILTNPQNDSGHATDSTPYVDNNNRQTHKNTNYNPDIYRGKLEQYFPNDNPSITKKIKDDILNKIFNTDSQRLPLDDILKNLLRYICVSATKQSSPDALSTSNFDYNSTDCDVTHNQNNEFKYKPATSITINELQQLYLYINDWITGNTDFTHTRTYLNGLSDKYEADFELTYWKEQDNQSFTGAKPFVKVDEYDEHETRVIALHSSQQLFAFLIHDIKTSKYTINRWYKATLNNDGTLSISIDAQVRV